MNPIQNKIPVVYFTNGEPEHGILVYSENGPSILDAMGCTINESNSVLFKLRTNLNDSLPLKPDELVTLQPVFQIRMGYSQTSIGADNMYPPSTNNWISHVVDGGAESYYFVQNIQGTNRKLLSIINNDDSIQIIAHRVYPYEIALIKMKRDLTARKEMEEINAEPYDIYSVLDKNKPKWDLIGKLAEGLTISNLSLKSTMIETLEQLVPVSFPLDTRKQIMAFLAWLDKAEVPNVDPVEFRDRYAKAAVLRSLVSGHLRCLLDEVEAPPYVRIMMLADAGQLSLTERPTPIEIERNPWFIAQYRLYELFPDWMDRVLDVVESLNRTGQIITSLPVSKEDAMKSREAWSSRFALASQALLMRGHVQKNAIGLRTLIYVGAAHKWPHRHLEFSARLGFQLDKSLQIQVLVLPPSAIERVTRLLPNIHVINWEMNSSNLSLYDRKLRKWKINSSTIFKSLARSRSLKQLENEFGTYTGKKPLIPTKEQAIVLDLISWFMYLQDLENGRISEYNNIATETIKEILNDLRRKEVIRFSYLMDMQKLTSICISASGPANHVCSLTRSFLKHAPTADTRISDNGSSSLIIARVPEDEAFRLLTNLPSVALENKIDLKAYPISAYIGYRNNLYQRLLREDGSWDDDVTGLLSQVRLQSSDDE